MPGKRFVWLGVIGAYVMPPFMGAIGWILLAGPNAGWLNRIFRSLSGMGPMKGGGRQGRAAVPRGAP